MESIALASTQAEAYAVSRYSAPAGHPAWPDRSGDERAIGHALIEMQPDGADGISLHISNVEFESRARVFDFAALAANGRGADLAARAAQGMMPSEDQLKALAAVGEFRREGDVLALVVRFPLRSGASVETPDYAAAPGLPKWRMKRVLAYIEANYAEPVGLTDMADAVGLSPAYFAAQFRRATGLRPHEYLLRRRVHHAQEMLLDPTTSVVEVALSVGFQTQAHFTTVFKRFTGDTPCNWRRQNCTSL